MSTITYDLLVIGAGPAGEAAAMKARKAGKSVLVVDERKSVGGNCTHVGTIPSKALRHAVRYIMQYNTDTMFRDIGEPRWFSFRKIKRRAEKSTEIQVKMRTSLYGRNRIDLEFGKAHFTDKNTVEVDTHKGITEHFHFENVVLAVGSRPYHPDDIDFDHARIYDSDTILDLDHTPRRIAIYGAGVIGCEYASIFCGLGVKVDLIGTYPDLLPFLDDEISDALSYHLRDQGVLIRHDESYERVEPRDDCVIIHMRSGKKVKADALLWCHGRSGNTHELNLKAINLEANDRGQLDVNSTYQTEVEHVYAAGDVIGWPSLASAAYDQGRSAVAAILGESHQHFIDDVPTGIYTIPEISSIGQTGKELTKAKIPYEVGQAFFKTLARAQISGETVGMLKMYFHQETLEILGVHCFGYQASEIVHIGQAIMRQSGKANTIKYFVDTTFNYPTMAEAYRVAALNGLHRLV